MKIPYKGFVIEAVHDTSTPNPLYSSGVSFLQYDSNTDKYIEYGISAYYLPYKLIEGSDNFYSKNTAWILQLIGYKCDTDIDYALEDFMSGFPGDVSMESALQEALEGCLEDFKGRQKIEFLTSLYTRLGQPSVASMEAPDLLLIIGSTYGLVEQVLYRSKCYAQQGALALTLSREGGTSPIDTIRGVIGPEQKNIEVAYFMKNIRDGRYIK